MDDMEIAFPRPAFFCLQAEFFVALLSAEGLFVPSPLTIGKSLKEYQKKKSEWAPAATGA
jgi:hypothetical protein